MCYYIVVLKYKDISNFNFNLKSREEIKKECYLLWVYLILDVVVSARRDPANLMPLLIHHPKGERVRRVLVIRVFSCIIYIIPVVERPITEVELPVNDMPFILILQ